MSRGPWKRKNHKVGRPRRYADPEPVLAPTSTGEMTDLQYLAYKEACDLRLEAQWFAMKPRPPLSRFLESGSLRPAA